MKGVVYPSNFEAKIGFSLIREQCVALCTMQHARELLEGEGFTAVHKEIERRHALAEEMRQILLSEREAPTEEFYDIAEIVEKAKVSVPNASRGSPTYGIFENAMRVSSPPSLIWMSGYARIDDTMVIPVRAQITTVSQNVPVDETNA